MGKQRTAGLLLYRLTPDRRFEVLIGHMGGPLWARVDERGWSIPKGGIEPGESEVDAARREFQEEVGSPAPSGDLIALGEFPQSRKLVVAFAAEGEIDAAGIRSNTFEMEWPRGSGQVREYPEIDRAAWVDPATAALKLVAGQVPIVDTLRARLHAQGVIRGGPTRAGNP